MAITCNDIEKKVLEKTKDLVKINEKLHVEIQEHKRTSHELRKARAEAEAANKAKNDFLANMSHEFRLPLNHIIGFTELLLSKNFGDLNKIQEEYLNDVLQSSHNLLYMLSDILDLAQVDSAKTKLDLSETNLEVLLKNCLVTFKESAEIKSIVLSMNAERLPDSVYVDKSKIKKIIHSLLSNAIKFTPAGGKVIMNMRISEKMVRSGRRQDDSLGFRMVEDPYTNGIKSDASLLPCIEFSIRDTGIGVSPEDQTRIFNMFEQFDTSSEKRYQGIGLGLYLSKKLVEMQGGRILVESRGENKGSVFSFIIPLIG